MYKNTNGDRSKRRRIVPAEPDPEPEEAPPENNSNGILEGFRIFIHQDINTTRQRVLRNLIRKNGGTNVMEADDSVTHILVDESVSGSKLCRSLRWESVAENVYVLAVGWLSASVQANELADYDSFSVACPRHIVVVDSPDTPNSENVERTDASGEDNFEIRTRKFAKPTARRSAYESVIESERKFWSPVDEGSTYDDYKYDNETTCDDEWLMIPPPSPYVYDVTSTGEELEEEDEEDEEMDEEDEEEEEEMDEEDEEEEEEMDEDKEEEDEDSNEGEIKAEEEDATEESSADDEENIAGPSTSSGSKPSTYRKRSNSKDSKAMVPFEERPESTAGPSTSSGSKLSTFHKQSTSKDSKAMVPFEERPDTTAGRLSRIRLRMVNEKDETGTKQSWVVVNLNKTEEQSTNEAGPSTSTEQGPSTSTEQVPSESTKQVLSIKGSEDSKAAENVDVPEAIPSTSGYVPPNRIIYEFPSSSSENTSSRKHEKISRKNKDLSSSSNDEQDDYANYKKQTVFKSWNPNIPSTSTQKIHSRKHKKKRKHKSAPTSPDVQHGVTIEEIKARSEEEEVTKSPSTSFKKKSYFRKHRRNKHRKSCLSPIMQGHAFNLEKMSVTEDMPHDTTSATTEKHHDRKKGKKKSRDSKSLPASPNNHEDINCKDLVSPQNALIHMPSTSTSNMYDEIYEKGKKGKHRKNKLGKINSAPATPNADITSSNFSRRIENTQDNLTNTQFPSNIQDKSVDDKRDVISDNILPGIQNSSTEITVGQGGNELKIIDLPISPDDQNESCKSGQFVPENTSTSSNGLTSKTAIAHNIKDDLVNCSLDNLPKASDSFMVSDILRKRKRSIDEEVKFTENFEQSYSYPPETNATSSAYLSTEIINSNVSEVSHVCPSHITVNSSDTADSVLLFNHTSISEDNPLDSSLLVNEALKGNHTSAAADKSLPSPNFTQNNTSEPVLHTIEYSTSKNIRELPQSSKSGSFLQNGPEPNYSASVSSKNASFDSHGTLSESVKSKIETPNLPKLDTPVAVASFTASSNTCKFTIQDEKLNPKLLKSDISIMDSQNATSEATLSPSQNDPQCIFPTNPSIIKYLSLSNSPEDQLSKDDILNKLIMRPKLRKNVNGVDKAIQADDCIYILPDISVLDFCSIIDNTLITSRKDSMDKKDISTVASPQVTRSVIQYAKATVQGGPSTSSDLHENKLETNEKEFNSSIKKHNLECPKDEISVNMVEEVKPVKKAQVSLPEKVSLIEKSKNENLAGTLTNLSGDNLAGASSKPTGENLAITSPIPSGENLAGTSPNPSGESLASTSPNLSGAKVASTSLNPSGESLAGTSPNLSGENLAGTSSNHSGENLAGTSTNPSGENLACSPNPPDGNIVFLVGDLLDKLESKLNDSQDIEMINKCNDLLTENTPTTENASTEMMCLEEDFPDFERMEVDSSSDSSESEEMDASDIEDITEHVVEQFPKAASNLIKPNIPKFEFFKCDNSVSPVICNPFVSANNRPYPVTLFYSDELGTVNRLHQLSRCPQTEAVLTEIRVLKAQLEAGTPADVSCQTEDFYVSYPENPNYEKEEAERLERIRWGFWRFPKANSEINASDDQSMPQEDEITNNSEVAESVSAPPSNINSDATNSIPPQSTDIEMNNPDSFRLISDQSNITENTEHNGAILSNAQESTSVANATILGTRPDVTGRNLFFPLPSERPQASTSETTPAQPPPIVNPTVHCYLSTICPNYNVVAKLQELYDFVKMSRDVWRIHAYEKAIFALGKYPKKIESLLEAQAIRGVGRKISYKVWEIIRTGHLEELDDFCNKGWITVRKLFTKGWGITPYMARKLYLEEFFTVDEAWREADCLDRSQRLALQYYKDLSKTMTKDEAEAIVNIVTGFFKKINKNLHVEACSTLRRNKKVCSHVSVLVVLETAVENDRRLLDDVIADLRLKGYIIDDLVRHEWNGNQSKYSGVFQVNKTARFRRVDIVVAPHEERICAKFFMTGPSYFLRAMVRFAERKDMVLDEHHLRFRILNMYGGTDGVTYLALHHERSIFHYIGLPYRTPEERDIIPFCTFLNC